MSPFRQAFPPPPPPGEAERFLRLLAELSRDQALLLEENRALRARVQELEAQVARGGRHP